MVLLKAKQEKEIEDFCLKHNFFSNAIAFLKMTIINEAIAYTVFIFII